MAAPAQRYCGDHIFCKRGLCTAKHFNIAIFPRLWTLGSDFNHFNHKGTILYPIVHHAKYKVLVEELHPRLPLKDDEREQLSGSNKNKMKWVAASMVFAMRVVHHRRGRDPAYFIGDERHVAVIIKYCQTCETLKHSMILWAQTVEGTDCTLVACHNNIDNMFAPGIRNVYQVSDTATIPIYQFDTRRKTDKNVLHALLLGFTHNMAVFEKGRKRSEKKPNVAATVTRATTSKPVPVPEPKPVDEYRAWTNLNNVLKHHLHNPKKVQQAVRTQFDGDPTGRLLAQLCAFLGYLSHCSENLVRVLAVHGLKFAMTTHSKRYDHIWLPYWLHTVDRWDEASEKMFLFWSAKEYDWKDVEAIFLHSVNAYHNEYKSELNPPLREVPKSGSQTVMSQWSSSQQPSSSSSSEQR